MSSDWITVGALFVVVAVLYFLYCPWRPSSWEGFTMSHPADTPIDPECANATPMDLIKIYKNQTEKMANDLKSTGLPESVLSDPAQYPRIMSTLKKLKLIDSCQA
jgi:hypothetical protein